MFVISKFTDLDEHPSLDASGTCRQLGKNCSRNESLRRKHQLKSSHPLRGSWKDPEASARPA